MQCENKECEVKTGGLGYKPKRNICNECYNKKVVESYYQCAHYKKETHSYLRYELN